MQENNSGKRIPWYQNFNGIQIILFSFFCLGVFLFTNLYIFVWAFLISLIVGIIKIVKERKAKVSIEEQGVVHKHKLGELLKDYSKEVIVALVETKSSY